MLKYNDIITKLTDEQKIRILTGFGNISGKELEQLGIPKIKIANMKDYGKGLYPHPASLSHSWNAELWEKVALNKSLQMRDDGVNFAIASGAKIKISPYRKEITEDPYLASIISSAYMKAAAEGGIVAGASGYYVAESDVDWMDSEPNERILNEYVVYPYLDAAKDSGTDIIVTDARVPSEAYKNSCTYVQNAVSDKVDFLVCEHADDSHTVDYVNRGIICLNASSNALTSALTRYKKLEKKLDTDRETFETQLAEALADNTAISEQSIDNALDQELDFIFRCADPRYSLSELDESSDSLARRAVLESTVLVKNTNAVLPLSKDKKVAIIGDIAFSDKFDEDMATVCMRKLEEAGYIVIGISRGYDLNNINNERFFADALDLCDSADTVLFFCGAGYESERQIHKTEKLTLPPNQLFLAERLAKKGKAMVAIITSDHAPDIGFSENFGGVLLTPTEVKYSGDALVDILTGEYSPTGRLAYTLYSDTENSFAKARAYMKHYGIKIGPFIGYRYYDTAGMSVGYPFGHGLSYTEFKYSGISVNKNQVSFTVKNVGAVYGTETAQVYVGKKNSSVLRPKKELCGFVKIELAPLEEKQVTLSVEPSKIYYNGEFVTEQGEYTVYIGASVSDIRLKGEFSCGGTVLNEDRERLSDYLQTYSNILEGNYTLEADYSFMKKTSKNMLIGLGAIALAVSIAIFNVTTHLFSFFLGIIAAILAICAIIFFIVEGVERSKEHDDQREEIEEANKAHFEGAERIANLSTETMFRDSFDVEKEEKSEAKEIEDYNVDRDYAQYINTKLSLTDAIAEFVKFSEEKGFKLNKGVAENLFSSLMTSRFMIFSGVSAEGFNSFMLMLSDYFGSKAYVDIAKDEIAEGKSVFFDTDSQGYQRNKNLISALSSAKASHERIQFAAIDGISENNIEAWLEPFVRYVKTPRTRNQIYIFDENGKNRGDSIGRNLWIVMRAADAQGLDSLPAHVMKMAAVVDISFTKCPVSDEHMTTHGFSSYQADYFLKKDGGNKDVSEDMWKKIDKLEKYAQQYSDYSIGNKLWLDLEKKTSMLLACGIDAEEAIDAAVSICLLPSIVATLKNKITKEDRTVLQTVEAVFGEDNVQYSKAFILGAAVKNNGDSESVGSDNEITAE